MSEVLGINPLAAHWRAEASTPAERVLGQLVESLIADRNAARAAKDFAAADRIRDELAAAGVSVEDGTTGSHWSIE
jgi:cysteinyl-tRNA synthetase